MYGQSNRERIEYLYEQFKPLIDRIDVSEKFLNEHAVQVKDRIESVEKQVVDLIMRWEISQAISKHSVEPTKHETKQWAVNWEIYEVENKDTGRHYIFNSDMYRGQDDNTDYNWKHIYGNRNFRIVSVKDKDTGIIWSLNQRVKIPGISSIDMCVKGFDMDKNGLTSIDLKMCL